MPVTSTTLAGINVWRLSGSVTDAELKTAWASLIVNNRYKIGRYIYVDDTCNLLGVRGTYYVDCEALGIILHSSRNKANTLFTNWIFTQTVGLSVANRGNFVRVTNGTTVTQSSFDGIDMKGGGMIYAVVGNPGGGDPRFLNEMMFGSLDGTIVTSQAFTEQELQPSSYGTIWRGLNIQKCANIPIVSSGNQVVYRTNFNTEILIANPISLYSGANGCFISTVMRKQGATFTNSLANTFGSTGTTTIMILNNWQDESYFGAAKTTIAAQNWNAGNRFVGGVLKKIQVLPSTLIRTYDSRSTTVSQKSTFSETTADFLTGTDSTTSNATTGRASIVCVGAIATGSARTIVRYTGQRFTLQKFGYKVQVETPDMTFGDDDLSAFSPITMTVQDGISRTEAEINAATSIDDFQELLEELHVLAIGLQGSASYSGFANGNLFNFSGGILFTNFTTVNVDATASNKISFNSTTNTLTIKSTTLTDNSVVNSWNNAVGAINLLNGAAIQGVYTTSTGTATIWEFQSILAGTSLAIYDGSGVTKYFNAVTTDGTYRYYIPPQSSAVTYYYAIEKYGTKRETGSFPSNAGGVLFYVPSYAEDVGITQTTQATVAAYTAIENEDKLYDYTAYKRLSEQFIKLGQLTTRDGTKLVIDAGYSVVVNQSAASVESISGSTITIKSTSYGGGSKYTTTKLTPPATFTANSTEVISGNIEDGNGDSSLTIVGGDDLGYELWKVTTATATNDYATGTLLNDTIMKGQKYRFIGISGYDIVGIDTNSNVRRRSSMAYGVYTQSFYVGDQIQLADDAPSLQALTSEIQILKVSVEAMPADFLAETVETGATVAQSLRLSNSVLGGKVSGAGTGTETFRDLADTKDRVVSTVTPEGNRTAETYDLD